MSSEEPANPPRRPSGAPEIPEILRETAPPRRPKPRFKLFAGLTPAHMRAISIGLDFSAMVGGGALLGWLTSEAFGSKAWLWAWIGLGFASAGWKFYKDAKALKREVYGPPKPRVGGPSEGDR